MFNAYAVMLGSLATSTSPLLWSPQESLAPASVPS